MGNQIIGFLQVLVLGQAGEEVSLELILRVVADVGLVVSTYNGDFDNYYCFADDAFNLLSSFPTKIASSFFFPFL